MKNTATIFISSIPLFASPDVNKGVKLQVIASQLQETRQPDRSVSFSNNANGQAVTDNYAGIRNQHDKKLPCKLPHSIIATNSFASLPVKVITLPLQPFAVKKEDYLNITDLFKMGNNHNLTWYATPCS